YMRNFIARFAWMRANSLLLISGAFASFRRDALLAVGGFDPQCLVEDYELIHRLRRYSVDHGLDWDVRVVGDAHAHTDAPDNLGSFLRQRRRGFAGFLQTQYWNRDMTGNPRYGVLGMLMLPVKAIDTMQPIYGLTAFALLLGFLFGGHGAIVVSIFSVIGLKTAIDLAFYLWSIHLYRRWTGERSGNSLVMAMLAALAEPFSFQLLRQVSARRPPRGIPRSRAGAPGRVQRIEDRPRYAAVRPRRRPLRVDWQRCRPRDCRTATFYPLVHGGFTYACCSTARPGHRRRDRRCVVSSCGDANHCTCHPFHRRAHARAGPRRQ